MKQFYVVLCLILACQIPALAQVDCDNIGFEKGTLLGWTQSHGSMTEQNQTAVYGSEIGGTTGTLHYITSLANGNDPVISFPW